MHSTPRRRRWPRLLLPLVLALILLPVLLGLQREPLLPPATQQRGGGQLATEARLLWQQMRPGAAPPGAMRHTRFGEAQLNALLDQAAAAQGGRWRAQLRIGEQRLQLLAQHPAPGLPAWLNLRLEWDLREARPGQLPPLTAARLGRLPLPASWLQPLALELLQRRAGLRIEPLLPMIESWRAAPQQLWLNWRWRPDRAAQAVATLWSAAERDALRDQHRGLRDALQAWPAALPVELEPLLRQQARRAQGRVEAQGADPAAELRALLTVLTLQSLGRDLGHWLPELAEAGPAPQAALYLRGRDDMSQHFLLAALLSWQGGERLALALGLAKELADARVGSGFSFNDLAADEAGTRFGRLCAEQPARVLGLLAQGLPAAAYFPDIEGLPEFLPEAEFRRRYGRVGSPAYEAEMGRARQRVDALPLYRDHVAAPASSPW